MDQELKWVHRGSKYYGRCYICWLHVGAYNLSHQLAHKESEYTTENLINHAFSQYNLLVL